MHLCRILFLSQSATCRRIFCPFPRHPTQLYLRCFHRRTPQAKLPGAANRFRSCRDLARAIIKCSCRQEPQRAREIWSSRILALEAECSGSPFIRRTECCCSGNFTCAASPLTDLPADFYQFDGQRMILYTARSILNGGFEIDTYDLGAQLQLASVSLPKAGASSIWDFELSPDGTLLYIVDNQFRIRRIQTDSLAVDLTFTVPSDVPGTLLDNLTLNVMPLADMAESLVITTPAGRMFLWIEANRVPTVPMTSRLRKCNPWNQCLRPATMCMRLR